MPPDRLADRRPDVAPSRLVADMVPPPRFRDVSFDGYRADPAVPSQAAAVAAARSFAAAIDDGVSMRRRGWFRSRPAEPGQGSGLYLDGGFGVGKTHLLASLWHAAPTPAERKLFCTFVELTNLAGALGFGATVEALSTHQLVCVDEFELDDPGDTVLVSTLLARLSERGVRLAATSNTLPDQLGEGRFAAADFLREIQRLAARFTVVRVDGDDYRHRGLPSAPSPVPDAVVVSSAETEGEDVTLDDFDALVAHLATVHPSRYGPLLDGVRRVHLRGVRTVDDQATALRLVVLADRLYDRDLPVVAGGVPLDRLFTAELLAGGYRKKYFRAVSRLTALSRDGAASLESR